MVETIFDKHRQEFKNEIDYHRYWKDMYEKERKLRQEAEGETNIVKAVGMNSPEMKDANKKIAELQFNLDKIKKENNDLYNRDTQFIDDREITRLIKALETIAAKMRKWV